MFRRRAYGRLAAALLIAVAALGGLGGVLRRGGWSCGGCGAAAASRDDDDDEGQRRRHVLAVIVPFRDRFDELIEFVPHLGRFLDGQRVAHRIYVANQVDSHRFNRASLVNAAFVLSRNECDYVAIHDVDLLPLSAALDYGYPAADVVHLSPPGLHPKYHYAGFFGGVVVVTRRAFERVNGMSNRFWGWGREDDEFSRRIYGAGLTIGFPANVTTGNQTFRHVHDAVRRPRDYKRVGETKDWWTAATDATGLSDVRFALNATTHVTVAGYPATLFNVALDCRLDKTPWCDDVNAR